VVAVDDLGGGQLPVGRRIALFRKRAGLTQAGLAHRLHRSKSWVEKIESGERQLDSFKTTMELAAALGIRVRDLRDDLDALAPGHEVLPALRRSLISRPPAGEPRLGAGGVPLVAAEVVEVGRQLVTSAAPFAEQGPAVPPLVAELRAITGNGGAGEPEALRALVLASLLAARIASELRHPDLAWIAADLGMRAAQRAGDERYAAAVACRLARGAQREGEIDEAWQIVTEHAEPLRQAVERNPGDDLARSAYGALRQLAAVIAARSGDHGQATAFIADARAAAAPMDADGLVLWTAFGPGNVALHEASCLLEAGNPDGAIAVSRAVDPGKLSTAERRLTHRVQLAHAHSMRHRTDEAYWQLLAAERVSPETLERNTLARELVRGLLRRKGRKPAGLRALATRLRVTD
jgi:transcriptional regulator with XRE-family HTH domain